MNQILETKVDKRLVWYCPGCKSHHEVPVAGPKAWKWDGNVQNPTLHPSVLIDYGPNPPPDRPARCHCFVREGRIEFLSDCSHVLAGYTMDMVSEPQE